MSRILSVACLALVLLAGVAPSARPVRSRGHLHALRAWGSRGRHGPGVHGGRQRRERHLVESGRLAFLRGHDISVTHSQLVPGLADDVSWSYPVYAQHVEGWGGFRRQRRLPELWTERGDRRGRQRDGHLHVLRAGPRHRVRDRAGRQPRLRRRAQADPGRSRSRDRDPGRTRGPGDDVRGRSRRPREDARARTSIGAVLSNLGPDIAYIDEDQSDPLGRNIRVGAAYTPFENDVHRVLVAADASRFLIPGRVLAVDAWNADSNTSSTGSSPSAADTSAIPSATSRTGRSDWG